MDVPEKETMIDYKEVDRVRNEILARRACNLDERENAPLYKKILRKAGDFLIDLSR